MMWWFIHLLIISPVSGTPTGFNTTRLSSGVAHIRLSWSTVSGATGYEVYYKLSSNTPISIGNTTNTTVDITSGLDNEATYTFYVVSYVSNYSAVLPSENSSTILTFSKYMQEFEHCLEL